MINLTSLINAADRATVTESNMGKIDTSLAFMLTPTIDPTTGIANIITGPPTGAAWQINQLWVDVNGGIFACTVAGTPGTWQQIQPAVTAADPVAPIAGYVIARTGEHLKMYYWSGSAWTAV